MTSAIAGEMMKLPPAGNTEQTRPENRLFFPALDGLRAVAFLLVFYGHYLAPTRWVYTGVDLFFVLSGFLITGILYDTRNRADRVPSFFIRRALRIFPLYYGVLALLVLATPIAHFQWNKYWLVWPAYLGNIIRFVHPYSTNPAYLHAANGQLVVQNSPGGGLRLGHFWSLSLEEQFYLAWPWVVFWVKDRRRLICICTAVVIVMPIARILVMSELPLRYTELELPYSFTPLRLDALLFGGLLALLYRSRHRDLTLKIARYALTVALPLVLLFLAITLRKSGYPSWRLTWGQSLVDLFYTLVIASALVPGTLVFRLGNLSPLRWLGRISYGLYVFHDIPHGLYARFADHLGSHSALVAAHLSQTTAIIGIAATILIAWLSFTWFETPFLNLKERFAPSHRVSKL